MYEIEVEELFSVFAAYVDDEDGECVWIKLFFFPFNIFHFSSLLAPLFFLGDDKFTNICVFNRACYDKYKMCASCGQTFYRPHLLLYNFHARFSPSQFYTDFVNNFVDLCSLHSITFLRTIVIVMVLSPFFK